MAWTLQKTSNFTASDGTDLSTYDSDWVTDYGAGRIESNQLDVVAELRAHLSTALANDQRIVVKNHQNGIGGYCLRYTSTGAGQNDFTGYMVIRNGGDVVLYKCTNGTFDQLDTATDSFTAGEEFDFQIIGTSLTVDVDGSNVLSATDATYGSGSGGLRTPLSLHPYCDDFLLYDDAGGGATTRGMPFGGRGTAFNGGRTLAGVIR